MTEKIMFPEMIEKLPDIDINLTGVRGKLLQGQKMQVVFFTIENKAEIPPHHHQAQWGVLLEGEVLLTIEGQARRCSPGDSYYIPAGAVHSIQVLSAPVKALDVFNDPNRYQTKET